MRSLMILSALLLTPLAAVPVQADNVAKKNDAQPGLFVGQGETWFFKIVDGQPANPRKGGENEKPGSDEIKVSLDGGNMIVLNGTATPYNYQAFIAKKPSDKGNRTSVCTLMPGVTVFENWPGSLPGIRLANFSDAGEGMICA